MGENRVGWPSSAPDPAVSLSLVIPAYNEGLRLEDGVARLRGAIEAGAILPESTEFVVVDDGSTDDTSDCARDLFSSFPHVRLIRLPQNTGKGGAVRAGVAEASAPIIAFADADMAIDPAQTPEFARALRAADLAIGSRAASGASVNRPSLQRSLMNRAFNLLVNALTKVSLQDTQCGFKAFRAPVAKLLFHCTVTERFAFDVEILSLARRLGLVIAEVPVQWLRVQGSQIRPWTDARSMAGDVLRASRAGALGPPVPTLMVAPATDGATSASRTDAVRDALAPGLPVLPRTGGATLVLCPLMGEAHIEAVAARITSLYPEAVLERTETTVAQLVRMAPLSLTSGAEKFSPRPGEHTAR
jgi:dolichyl-phosphate beta-glucosyltransferase